MSQNPWSFDEIIENSEDWNLAADVALLNTLKSFGNKLRTKSLEIDTNLRNLGRKLDETSLHLDIARNTFQSLRNSQFIESRVYEDDETIVDETKTSNGEEERDLNEAAKYAALRGLELLERYFDKVELAASDSEEDDVPTYVLRPKDLYIDRPLPYVIGSDEWHKHQNVGLDSSSESEAEKVVSDSDSELELPDDKSRSPTLRTPEAVSPEPFNLAEQLAEKLADIKAEEVNTRPIQQKPRFDIFFDEPPPILEDEGLFSGGSGLFNEDSTSSTPFKPSKQKDLFFDENDDEIFSEKPMAPVRNTIVFNEEPPRVSDTPPSNDFFGTQSPDRDLFADDEFFSRKPLTNDLFRDDDDIFNDNLFATEELNKTPKLFQDNASDFAPKAIDVVDKAASMFNEKKGISLFDSSSPEPDDLFSDVNLFSKTPVKIDEARVENDNKTSGNILETSPAFEKSPGFNGSLFDSPPESDELFGEVPAPGRLFDEEPPKMTLFRSSPPPSDIWDAKSEADETPQLSEDEDSKEVPITTSIFNDEPPPIKCEVSPKKETLKPGKLQHNLNINVAALLPRGRSVPVRVEDKEPTVEVLQSVTKNRATLPLNRRPSTRRGRQEARAKSKEDTIDREDEITIPIISKTVQEIAAGTFLATAQSPKSFIPKEVESKAEKSVSKLSLFENEGAALSFESSGGLLPAKDDVKPKEIMSHSSLFEDDGTALRPTESPAKEVETKGEKILSKLSLFDEEASLSPVESRGVFLPVADDAKEEKIVSSLFEDEESSAFLLPAKDEAKTKEIMSESSLFKDEGTSLSPTEFSDNFFEDAEVWPPSARWPRIFTDKEVEAKRTKIVSNESLFDDQEASPPPTESTGVSTSKEIEAKTKKFVSNHNLFEDDEASITTAESSGGFIPREDEAKGKKIVSKSNLFGDESSDDDLFANVSRKPTSVKESLFDDDDDDDDDIFKDFSSRPKVKTTAQEKKPKKSSVKKLKNSEIEEDPLSALLK